MAHQVCDIFGRITKDETRARQSMMFSIRLHYLSRAPHTQESLREASDDFEARVTKDTPLSDAYALLNEEQRKCLREATENPPLRVFDTDGTQWWIEESLHLLDRLERGEQVGPVNQTQLPRAVGTKAF